MHTARNWLWSTLAIVIVAIAFAYGQVTAVFYAASTLRSLLFFLLGLCGVGLVFCWPSFQCRSREALVLCVLSVLIRTALLPCAPSDDIYRYLWEGKLVREGISPYGQTADAAELEPLRDGYWQQMNHVNKHTAYPALAQLVFAAVGWVNYEPLFLKLFFVLVDVVVVLLLIRILQLQLMPIRWAGFYALSPVSVVAFAGEGHFDVLLVAAMLASLWFFLRHKAGWAWFYLGVAVQFKFVAVLLVPFLFKYTRLQCVWPFVVAILLPCLPFMSTLPELLEGLSDFATTYSFNGAAHSLLLGLTGHRAWANGIAVVALVGVLLWRFLRRSKSCAFIDDTIWALGALIVLAPTMHFWYLTWVIGFLVLRPSLAWVVFGISQMWYFGVWRGFEATGQWHLSWIEQSLLWGPFVLIGLYELRWMWVPRVSRKDNPWQTSEPTISVVIPTFNAGEVLADCLASLHRGTRQPIEVLIVDGGSTDATANIARNAHARWIKGPKGRGAQIRAGVLAAQGEVILVMHADCVVSSTAVETLIAYMHAHPDVVGGALGQRFDSSSFALLWIEMLNEARATLKGGSFGDQGQFFIRDFAASIDGFPAIPLMEDVEMGQRMLRHGRVAYLGETLTVSASKWLRQGWWRRFATVIRLTIYYRVARIFCPGKMDTISQSMYDSYYK